MSTGYPRIILHKGKEAAVKRFHPWIFSGAIHSKEGHIGDGDLVEVFSASKEFLATGYYQEGSIAVKIISFIQREINEEFWMGKLREAYDLRVSLGLASSDYTNAYRLVFGEGDGIPGLIIDYYNGVCVIQAQTSGIQKHLTSLVHALEKIYGERVRAIYHKSDPGKPGLEASSYLLGSSLTGRIRETGHPFLVDWEKGQKTGFFLDQRSNRMFAQFYAKDRKVLNAFCYSGAFSVYALKGGARMVHSVDSSKQALEWCDENIAMNGIDPAIHRSVQGDLKDYLGGSGEKYDMIILDPPAFAKTHTVTHNALQAYRHINAQAMKMLEKNGILFTFSCSQAVNRANFLSIIMAASLETGRRIRVIHQLSQGPDHPFSVYHPEGEYLKGLILAID